MLLALTKATSGVAKVARDLLLSTFLLAEGPRSVDEKFYPAASYLASEGALRHVRGMKFQIASPLLRLVLMSKLGVMGDFAKPLVGLPYTSTHQLDVVAIIKEAINYFDKTRIQQASSSSFKRNKAIGKYLLPFFFLLDLFYYLSSIF